MAIQAVASFIVLSILGIAISGYLTRQHYSKKSLVCPMNHDCSKVTESKYGKTFSIKNEVLGLLFYIGMLTAIIISIYLPYYSSQIYQYIFYTEIFAVLFSAWLVYVQLRILEDYCFYCMMSALVTFLMLVNSLFLL